MSNTVQKLNYTFQRFSDVKKTFQERNWWEEIGEVQKSRQRTEKK